MWRRMLSWFGYQEAPTPDEPVEARSTPGPVRVAIDLADDPGGACKFHMYFMPDGIFDPTCQSHRVARDIQVFLNKNEADYQDWKRKQEQALIMKGVLGVCAPITAPLEGLKGPSEANN